MATIIKPSYGAKVNLTITLASLATSAVTGRQSNAVDNSTDLALDSLVQGIIETGTGVAGSKQILIYVAGSADGGTTYSGKNGSSAIGASDAGFSRADPTDLKLLGVLPTPSSNLIFSFGPYSVAQAFGGLMPDHWALVIFNDSGVALSSTAANNKAWYTPINATSV